MSEQPRHILLTGATGFIGRAFIDRLASAWQADTYELFAMVRPGRELDFAASRIEHDLRSPLDLSSIPDGIDAIVHIAGATSHTIWGGFREHLEINALSTVDLLEAARIKKVPNFIYVSTISSLKPSIDEPERRVNEATPLWSGWIPPYPLGKKVGEELCITYRSVVDHVAIVRPGMVYGPSQTETSEMGQMQARLEAAVDVAKLPGNGRGSITPVYIDDVTRALLHLLEHPMSETLNVFGPEVLSERELYETIADRLGLDLELEFIAGPEDRFASHGGELDRLLELVPGWEPTLWEAGSAMTWPFE